MSAQLSAQPIDWTRWIATGGKHGGWRLIRFESVDAHGNPVGKAIEAQTPTLRTRLFRTEQLAMLAANALNQEEGR